MKYLLNREVARIELRALGNPIIDCSISPFHNSEEILVRDRFAFCDDGAKFRDQVTRVELRALSDLD